MENYPDVEKSAQIIQHDVQGFIVNILQKWFCCINNSNCYQVEHFHKT